MNEEGISWDTLPQSLESQDDSNDMLSNRAVKPRPLGRGYKV
ncbi:hypothetical protein [Pasteurella multocida]|nr:hypothetical protein [Pasteurella multocida]MDA5613806.1 hypothetical protein [Pasteurella multocida]